MTYPEYVDALCLVALVAYAKPRFDRESSEPAEKIDSLLKYCDFRKSAGDHLSPQEESTVPSASAKAVDDLQTMSFTEGAAIGNYSLSLLSECVIPPENCPPEVGALLEQAFDNHNRSNFAAAISLYEQARVNWDKLYPGDLPLEHKLYFVVAIGGVLQSDGQDRKALDLYQIFENEVPEPNYFVLSTQTLLFVRIFLFTVHRCAVGLGPC